MNTSLEQNTTENISETAKYPEKSLKQQLLCAIMGISEEDRILLWKELVDNGIIKT